MQLCNKKTGQIVEVTSSPVHAQHTIVRHTRLADVVAYTESNYQEQRQEEQEATAYPVLSESFFSCLYSCYDDDGYR